MTEHEKTRPAGREEDGGCCQSQLAKAPRLTHTSLAPEPNAVIAPTAVVWDIAHHGPPQKYPLWQHGRARGPIGNTAAASARRLPPAHCLRRASLSRTSETPLSLASRSHSLKIQVRGKRGGLLPPSNPLSEAAHENTLSALLWNRQKAP